MNGNGTIHTATGTCPSNTVYDPYVGPMGDLIHNCTPKLQVKGRFSLSNENILLAAAMAFGAFWILTR